MKHRTTAWMKIAVFSMGCVFAGGCGSVVDAPDSSAGDEDAIRMTGRCGVLPNPVTEGGSYTVTGDGFSRLKAIRVRVHAPAGASETVVTADGSGSFQLTASATSVGSGEVTVFTEGRAREALLASCTFTVVPLAAPCGDGICAADEDCTSCALDCACPELGPGAFTLGAATYSVGESDGSVAITIERLGGSAGAAAVEWRTLSSTAAFDVDYQSFTWTALSFADGEARKVEAITILPDSLDEADETFTVLLRNPTGGATLGAVTTATVTIVDDDAAGVDPCATVTCSGHGTCASSTGSAACTCDAGFHAEGLSCLADVVTPPPPAGELPVFPGAAGPGTSTTAGRGGVILKVTNLNDSGAGSLRAAITASGPRIVVFEVSGYIQLASRLRVANPFLTIAGQTAPSPGVCLRGEGISIRSHDVLVQHIAIRSSAPEGLEILGPSNNIVVDHVSATWATDENMSTWYDGVIDVTYSNNLIAEGLLGHSMGLLLGAGFDRVALIRNVMAHNSERNPRVQCGPTRDTHLLMVNNLIYNHTWDCAAITGVAGSDFPVHVNGINNVAIDGPETLVGKSIYGFGGMPSGTTLFTSGDAHFAYGATSATGRIYGGSPTLVGSSDFDLSPYGIWTTSQVRSSLTATAGARPADRDPQDQRILDSIAAGTGTQIASPDEVGGYTPLATNQRTFVVPADPNGDSDGDGYTNVEELLHQLAVAVEE